MSAMSHFRCLLCHKRRPAVRKNIFQIYSDLRFSRRKKVFWLCNSKYHGYAGMFWLSSANMMKYLIKNGHRNIEIRPLCCQKITKRVYITLKDRASELRSEFPRLRFGRRWNVAQWYSLTVTGLIKAGSG